MGPRLREDDGHMDPRFRENDGQMGPRFREDDGAGGSAGYRLVRSVQISGNSTTSSILRR